MRYFVVVCGPTGAGKTSLVSATLAKLGLPADVPMERFVIDDVIENHPVYKERVRAAIAQMGCGAAGEEGGEEKEECLRAALTRPRTETVKLFTDAYFDTRKRTRPCVSAGPPVSCDEMLDARMRAAATERTSKVAVFESTGESVPGWLFEPEFIPEDMQIVVAYSFARMDVLMERNRSRAYAQMSAFLADPDHRAAPRLPDLSEDVYPAKVRLIAATCAKLVEDCVHHRAPACGSRPVGRVLVFDNSGPQQTLKYDSLSSHQSPDAVIRRILTGSKGGGRKRKPGRRRTARDFRRVKKRKEGGKRPWLVGSARTIRTR